MPSMNAGRVTRSAIVLPSWQSMQATGWLHELGRLRVGHRVDLLEALDDVAVARLLVREVHRRVAVHARARLLHDHLPLREPLVLEHVGVAALFAEVFGEGVALPHGLEALVLFDLGARDDRARIGLGRRLRHGLAAAVLGALHVDRFLVELVVLRERLAPLGRVVDVVVEGRAAQLSLAGGVRFSGLRCAGGRNEQEDRRERSHAGARKRSWVAQPAGRCRVSEGLGRNLSLCHGPSRSPKTREYRAGRHRRLLPLRRPLNAARVTRRGHSERVSSTRAIEYAKRRAASGSLLGGGVRLRWPRLICRVAATVASGSQTLAGNLRFGSTAGAPASDRLTWNLSFALTRRTADVVNARPGR